MGDPAAVDAAVRSVEKDLIDYAQTLTHGDCLHLINHIGIGLGHAASHQPHTSSHEIRRTLPIAGFVLRVLTDRAARTRPSRPGGRAAFNHDSCDLYGNFAVLLVNLDRRIITAQLGQTR